MIYLIILFNAIRFIGLEISPPGFYADESLGATQVICISQTGADLAGNHFPLFSAFGTLIYTPAYIYGQLLWTSLFGYSITAFRSYPAFITTLTVILLFLYIRSIANAKVAMYVAFVATIMPWAFQFSRIAWDPPLGPFFLIFGLWTSTFKRGWWMAGMPLALSIYSYPPLRIITPLLWICLPTTTAKRKLVTLAVMTAACIPLALQYLEKDFLYRSNMLTIWSSAFYNPYRHNSTIEIIHVFYKNFIAHFSPIFLIQKGEGNLRHSTQTFGMLSWLDAVAIITGLFYIASKLFSKKYKLAINSQYLKLIALGILGICISIIPAALTNESSPNALRSISAWPFYAILSGSIICFMADKFFTRKIYFATLVIGTLFFLLYQYDYFYKYPIIAKEGFEAGFSNEILYPKLVSGEARCENLRAQIKSMDRNTRIGELIDFSQHGQGPITSYLNKHWYDRESWGIWSDGKNADLSIPIPHGKPKSLILIVNVLSTPLHPQQTVEVWIDQKFYQQVVFNTPSETTIEIHLSDSVDDHKQINIEFRTPNSVSPITAGLSLTDNRILGIGLRSAEFIK